MTPRCVFVTGGAGFIGSALSRFLIAQTDAHVVVIDKLTYAASRSSLATLSEHSRFAFEHVDVTDQAALDRLFASYSPDAVVHLAAETHVDRSIDGPRPFLDTNVGGTFTLLEAFRSYFARCSRERRAALRFHHVSTDEVYGALGAGGRFTEASPYAPRSPYSASKAASDHLVMAWHHTHELPVVITNSSNNYGPFQFPEKLIPLVILRGLGRQPMPIYGTGNNVRDWIHVDDHVRAIWRVLVDGRVGEKYLVGSDCERTNLEVVHALCDALDLVSNDPSVTSHRQLVTFVADRPGHDHRYAIDASKIRSELGWEPEVTFDAGITETVRWYVSNRPWWEDIALRTYGGERLGLAPRS